MDTKQKYVRLKRYNEIIIFPELMKHQDFANFGVSSAGFCYVDSEKRIVECFGESFSLGLQSDPLDSFYATKQIFGVDAALHLS